MKTIYQLIDENPSKFTDEFIKWIPENTHVWDAFVEQAFIIRKRGFKHYSARTIIHFLRHHSAIAENSSMWKINNNYSPYLARLFDLRFPQAKGLWEYRTVKTASKQIYEDNDE